MSPIRRREAGRGHNSWHQVLSDLVLLGVRYYHRKQFLCRGLGLSRLCHPQPPPKLRLPSKLTTCEVVSFEQYFEEFYRLVDQGTSERKEIKHHPKEYYKQQLTINNQQLKFVLFIAEHESKVIAANIVVFFGKTATYLHGATDNNFRNLMAPHLLQWEQIKEAKNRGCEEYDFWGVVNEHTLDRRGKSWEGFTRFKKGFGGREVNYVGYWDYPLNKSWYWLYRLVQKFRR